MAIVARIIASEGANGDESRHFSRGPIEAQNGTRYTKVFTPDFRGLSAAVPLKHIVNIEARHFRGVLAAVPLKLSSYGAGQQSGEGRLS